jgi:hypothetical protein
VRCAACSQVWSIPKPDPALTLQARALEARERSAVLRAQSEALIDDALRELAERAFGATLPNDQKGAK